MLNQLVIRDFVIVRHQEIHFGSGFGALTGETGAGKSMLVDALSFVLGERIDGGAGRVRPGRPKADVTACFTTPQDSETLRWLEDNGFESDDEVTELILRRTIDSAGKSRAWINGRSATLQQLRQLAEFLVDIHGQHAHQSLLRTETQRQLLDAGLQESVRAVEAHWKQLSSCRDALNEATRDHERLQEESDRLRYRIDELAALELADNEWESIELEHARLANAAGLLQGSQSAQTVLADGDVSALTLVAEALRQLHPLSDFDPALEEICTLLDGVEAELGEAVSSLRRYADRIELDPARLAQVERRMEAILQAARKYRCSPSELPALLERSRDQLASLENLADTEALQQALVQAEQAHRQACQVLSGQRQHAAQRLAQAVSGELDRLALAGGRFDVALVPVNEPGRYGAEAIEFQVGGLAGGGLRPLAKVVSGGELSRISLAIQVVTSRDAKVPTLIFDEVDVGIGGGVAEVVGRLLHQLGRERQVLCVTHLPQVAACADTQWKVVKTRQPILLEGEAEVSGTLQESVESQICLLENEERVEEIARMLGGVELTETTRQHAREMLGDRLVKSQ